MPSVARSFQAVLGMALLLTASWQAAPAPAQTGEPAPLVVICIAPMEKTINDYAAISAAIGVPYDAQAEKDKFTKSTGCDPTKPIALWLSVPKKENPEAYDFGTFAGITDPKAYEASYTNNGFQLSAEQNGIKQFTKAGTPPKVVSAKLVGSTMFEAIPVEAYSRLPRDTVALLGDLPNKYMFAIQLNLKEANPATIAKVLTDLPNNIDPFGESGVDLAPLKKTLTELGAQLKPVLNELSEFTLGVKYDSSTRTIRGEWEGSFKPGTPLANRLATVKALKSNFGGFAAVGNAFFYQQTDTITPSEKEVYKQQIQALRKNLEENVLKHAGNASPESAAARKAFADGITALLEETVDAGTFDAGFAAAIADKSLTLAAGLSVADGKKLDALVKAYAQAEKNNPDFPEMLVDYAAHQNVSIHFAKIPTPEIGFLKKILGDEIDVAIGTGEKTAWVVVGASAIDQLKRLLDESASAAAKPLEKNMQLKLNVGTVLTFLGATETDAGPLKTIGDAASKFVGAPVIESQQNPTEKGFKGDLVISEDVFKLAREIVTSITSSLIGGAFGAGS